METIDLERMTLARHRPLRRQEYDRLVEMGVFHGEHIELLLGMLVEMSPQGTEHHEVIYLLQRILDRALDDRAEVRSHGPIALSDDSEPEPDVMVIPPGDYRRTRPATAHLLVDVADSSLRDDRVLKGALYATAGIPEYWIVNLVERCVEVHRDPEGGAYRTTTRHAAGETLHLLAFPDVTVAVDQILR